MTNEQPEVYFHANQGEKAVIYSGGNRKFPSWFEPEIMRIVERLRKEEESAEVATTPPTSR